MGDNRHDGQKDRGFLDRLNPKNWGSGDNNDRGQGVREAAGDVARQAQQALQNEHVQGLFQQGGQVLRKYQAMPEGERQIVQQVVPGARAAEGLLQNGQKLLTQEGRQDLLRSGENIARQGGNVVERLAQGDLQGAGRQAQGLVQNKDLMGLAQMAVPQLGLLKKGAELVGGEVERSKMVELVQDPNRFSTTLAESFPKMDANSDGFVQRDELASSNGVLDAINVRSGFNQVVAAGYDKFASLDGQDADKGITSNDVDVLRRLYDDRLREDYISGETNESRLLWGAGGASAGAAVGALLSRVALGKFKPVAIVGSAVTAGALGAWRGGEATESNLQNFYAQKRTEMDEFYAQIRVEAQNSPVNQARRGLNGLGQKLEGVGEQIEGVGRRIFEGFRKR